MNTESQHEKELGGQLLASVSRSFYLTLKALPRELREPISLAYLLARTADTIADTAQVPASTRLDCLARFDRLIQGSGENAPDLAALLATQFQPLQTDAAEAELMRRFADGLAWLGTMDERVLIAIRRVLQTIIHGQRLDIERFPTDGAVRSLQTAAELDEYTYLVAGCVGEFWTHLCLTELKDAFVEGTDEQSVTEQGTLFGQGLQLVNILRDLGKDARLGRCYLPQEEWQTLGLTTTELEANPAVLRPVWSRWLTQCESHLRSAQQYVCAVKHSGLRYATALPLLLAWRTLARLRTASDTGLLAGVKVSRLDVASILAQTALHNSPDGIARLCAKQA